MGREAEFQHKKMLGINVEKEERDVLLEIALRETNGDISRLGRKALQEFIKAHKEGNDTYKLDNWQKDPTFHAVPTILSSPEKWYSYLQGCKREEKLRLLKQANLIKNQIISLGLQ